MPDKRIAHLQDLYSLLRQLEMALGERGRLLIAPVVLDGHKGEFTFFRTVESNKTATAVIGVVVDRTTANPELAPNLFL
jgi:hypothetical protein